MARAGVRATVLFGLLFLLLATSAAERSHERGLKDVLVIEDNDGISVLEVDDLELSTPAVAPSRVAEQPQQQQQQPAEQQPAEQQPAQQPQQQQPAGEQQVAAAYDDEDDDISMIMHALEQAEREENAFEAGSTATATDSAAAALSAAAAADGEQQQQEDSSADADSAPQETALLVLDTARAAGAEAVTAALSAASAARATAATAEAGFGTWASAVLDAASREAAQLFGAVEAQQAQLAALLGRRAGPFDVSSSEGPAHVHMGMGGMRRPCPQHAAMMAAAAAAASRDGAAAQPGFAFTLRGAPMLLGPFAIGPAAAATKEDAPGPAPAVLVAEPEAAPEAAPVEAPSPLGWTMVTVVFGFAAGTVAALVAAAVRLRSPGAAGAALASPRAHYAALASDDGDDSAAWVAGAKLQAPQHVLAWDPSLDGDADLKGPAVVAPRRAAALSEQSGAAAAVHYHNKLFEAKGQQV